jgi:type II secretory pathway component PulJ
MLNSTSNEKGIGLIEVCIAMFLLAIGVLGLIALQPSAWRQSGRSDFLGRAAGIMAKELQEIEAVIMNENNTPTVGEADYTVRASGQKDDPNVPMLRGDMRFNVHTETAKVANRFGVIDGRNYQIKVKVTWPGNANGIQESMIVTRQDAYQQ